MPSEAAEAVDFDGPPAPARSWWQRASSFLFDSLQGRFVLAMLGGLALVQLTVNLVWYSQIEQRVRRQTELAAHHVASGAIGAVRALRELPVAYRPLLIEQLRTMGGTRFLVFFNNAAVTVAPLPDQPMARMLEQQVSQELAAQLPKGTTVRVVLSSPLGLAVSPGGALLSDLPESWVEPSLIAAERPAPFLVIQAETEPGQWLYLSSTLPDPYFLEQLEFFTWQRLTPQLLALGLAVLLTLIAVRAITRPLAGLSQAAARVGRRVAPKPLRVSGTQEVRQAIEDRKSVV